MAPYFFDEFGTKCPTSSKKTTVSDRERLKWNNDFQDLLTGNQQSNRIRHHQYITIVHRDAPRRRNALLLSW
ncbi:hypothetical protein BDA96_02G086400 [Sorghum bicolor]|uniref:Uncharacterized protein n=1 Tax=Sorghum bicolor TaxID=4558 RepID=A0A921US35_SORBI|nr:hypothetical protein BDA96_02G086400 [Sorghum bicolor]